MKRYEKRRLEQDRQIDKLLKTPDGQTHYWNQLKSECQSSSMISLLESTLHLPGDVIECGVYRGRSVTRIGRTLAEQAAEKKLYACDSFEGFPGEMVGRVDVGLFRFLSRIRKKFRMCSDTPDRLERFFKTYNIPGETVKGFFHETLPRFQKSRFCFIHLDCDIYQSYQQCLDLLYDRLAPGGVVVFDDYDSSKWPGATKAVDEFCAAQPENVQCCEERKTSCWYLRKEASATQAAA
ncbi:MAG: TylF/MycF/NovP-related O-methyltransferase [Pirellulaceae bacterium]